MVEATPLMASAAIRETEADEASASASAWRRAAPRRRAVVGLALVASGCGAAALVLRGAGAAAEAAVPSAAALARLGRANWSDDVAATDDSIPPWCEPGSSSGGCPDQDDQSLFFDDMTPHSSNDEPFDNDWFDDDAALNIDDVRLPIRRRKNRLADLSRPSPPPPPSARSLARAASLSRRKAPTLEVGKMRGADKERAARRRERGTRGEMRRLEEGGVLAALKEKCVVAVAGVGSSEADRTRTRPLSCFVVGAHRLAGCARRRRALARAGVAFGRVGG